MRALDINRVQRYSLYKLLVLIASLFFLVISSASISLYISNEYIDDYENRVEINIKSNFSEEAKTIKQSNIEMLKQAFSSGELSYMNELSGIIEGDNAIYPVKAVLSGENTEKFLGLNLLRGTFFSSEQYQYGRRVAVISDTMAYKLFTTHHVIGNEIYISGLKYKIIGLYKNKTSLFSLLASDGIEKVYVPFDSMSQNSVKTINTIFIKEKTLEENSFREKTIDRTIKDILRTDINPYKINDFYNNSIYTSQPLLLFIFFVGVLLMCILLKYFFKYMGFGNNYFRNGIKNNYFLEVLLKWKIRIPLFLLFAVLIVLFISAIFWNVRFKGAIPAEFIPSDNVFDFSFYADRIKETIYRANNNAGYLPTQLEIVFSKNLIATYVLVLFLVINLVSVLSAIKLSKIVNESFAKQIIVLIIGLVVGLALSFILCLVCGIKFNFPVSEVAVLLLFLAIKLFDEKRIDAKFSQCLHKTFEA